MRLIDLDALHLAEYEPNTVMNTAATMAHNEVVRSVLSAPTVDAKPVVHGRWKDWYICSVCGHKDNKAPHYCSCCGSKMDGDVDQFEKARLVPSDDGDGVVCSNCGTDFCNLVHETEKFKFCPNCGAKMDLQDKTNVETYETDKENDV